ncbi:hypothetical Protein YC6258_04753 [Gynuella sunshinyii YC6258]|uniref:Uncharacterized protein n=1 Tax=Gynuella sunshinyii YC6258 TaxID=1445510 RepID=A0A0C5VBT7_9GAMM|nr:hypothetical Protein YC6258_04753 [Gynuella sunshinyii YC6258]
MCKKTVFLLWFFYRRLEDSCMRIIDFCFFNNHVVIFFMWSLFG